MIEFKELKTIEDFRSLKNRDFIACEFHQDLHQGVNKRIRWGVFEIPIAKHRTNEIILNVKYNNYFNYEMFLNPSESSNLKTCFLIKQI